MAASTDRPVPLCLFACLCHSPSAEEFALSSIIQMDILNAHGVINQLSGSFHWTSSMQSAQSAGEIDLPSMLTSGAISPNSGEFKISNNLINFPSSLMLL